MKLIWGYPGLIDGWGEVLTPFYYDEKYLAMIGRSGWNYTDIPPQRPHQYWKSYQEAENMYAIARLIGIYNVTRDTKDSLGMVQLYDIEG